MKHRLAAALLLSAAASSAAAQIAPAPSARRDPDMERLREQQRREMQLRRGAEAPGRPPDERAVKAAVKQLGEDFLRIQVVRNDLARALAAEAPLDYARVSGLAAELRRRALRMQAYLALGRDEKASAAPAGAAAGPGAGGEARLRRALARLCKRVDSFVENPRFKTPDVLDVGANARAGRDLREVISLSEGVREGADRLARPAHAAGRPED